MPITPVSALPSAWIRRFHPAPTATVRLVCLPHAGGSASYFFPVSRALSASVEVLAVQYPGRQDRRTERPVDDACELADVIAAELQPWTDLPFALFGHSLGATLGFEVAARLEAAGTAPLGLIASGRRAPSRSRDEHVHTRDDAGLVASLRAMAATHAAVLADDDLLRAVLPAVRADYKAAETYRHSGIGPLAEPVVVLVGDADAEVTIDEARAWAAHTTGAFDLRVFPGGHFYLNDHGATVLEVIRRFVQEWEAAAHRSGGVTPTA